MAIAVVGGTGRRVGKTALACGVIAALPDLEWVAVKITSHEHWTVEPIWEESEPGEETDTARYLAAGARRAFLLTVPETHDLNETVLGRVLGEFFRYAGRGHNVIFESNRVLHHVQPNLCLMIEAVSDAPEPKPSFQQAVRFADALVARGQTDGVRESSSAEVDDLKLPVFHLAQLGQVSPAMASWIREHLLGKC